MASAQHPTIDLRSAPCYDMGMTNTNTSQPTTTGNGLGRRRGDLMADTAGITTASVTLLAIAAMVVTR